MSKDETKVAAARIPEWKKEQFTKALTAEGYDSQQEFIEDHIDELIDAVPADGQHQRERLQEKISEKEGEKKELKREIRELERERDEKLEDLDDVEDDLDRLEDKLDELDDDDELTAQSVDEVIMRLADEAEDGPVTYEHDLVVYAKDEFDVNPIQDVLGRLYESFVHIPEEHIPDVVPSQYERQYDDIEHAKNEILRVYDAGDEDRAREMAKEAARKLGVKPSKVREAVEKEVGEDALTPDYLLN
jgi:DNA-binding transcriptional MerR regulator